MNAILKYPGSKWMLANWIISHFPEHQIYVEPYFGSGAVFFNKSPSKHEIINDIDGRVVNLFKVCREHPEELARLVNLTPYAREEFDFIQEKHSGEEINLADDDIENARRFLVRCWQCFGSKLSDRVGWKTARNSTAPQNPVIWGGLPEQIINIAERLKFAQIENRPAGQIIESCNQPDCLIYADPPYLGSTRGKRMYAHEMMGEAEHIDTLKLLKEHKGTVVISGYDSELYNDMLQGWQKYTHAATSTLSKQRTEVIWINYKYQMSIFDFG